MTSVPDIVTVTTLAAGIMVEVTTCKTQDVVEPILHIEEVGKLLDNEVCERKY